MGSPGSTNVTQKPEIPPELKPLISGSVGWALGLQNNLPLSQFTGFNPRGVAGLSPMQEFAMRNTPGLFDQNPFSQAAFNAIGTLPELTSRPVETPPAELAAIMQGLQIPEITRQPVSTPPGESASAATFMGIPEITRQPVGTPPSELAALMQLMETTGGRIGSSPTTKAGMEAWKSAVLPTVENEMIQAGLGRSGDLLRAVGESASQAAFPLLQQEVQNRMNSIPMLSQIANAQTERELEPRRATADALKFGSTLFNQMAGAQTERELEPRRATADALKFGANLSNQIAGAETERNLEPRRATADALKFGATQSTELARVNFDQRVAAIEQALRSGQISRDVAQQALDAEREEFSRLQSLSEAGTLGPLGQVLPSLIGSRTGSQKDLFSALLGK